MCQRRFPPVVGSKSGSQSDAWLSSLQAGGRVHTASASGARVHGESSGLIVLKEGKHTLVTPLTTVKFDPFKTDIFAMFGKEKTLLVNLVNFSEAVFKSDIGYAF